MCPLECLPEGGVLGGANFLTDATSSAILNLTPGPITTTSRSARIVTIAKSRPNLLRVPEAHRVKLQNSLLRLSTTGDSWDWQLFSDEISNEYHCGTS